MRWSVCADAQAGLRLCCSQTPKDRFSRVEAQLWYVYLFHIFKEHNMDGIIWIIFHNTLPVEDIVKPAIFFNW